MKQLLGFNLADLELFTEIFSKANLSAAVASLTHKLMVCFLYKNSNKVNFWCFKLSVIWKNNKMITSHFILDLFFFNKLFLELRSCAKLAQIWFFIAPNAVSLTYCYDHLSRLICFFLPLLMNNRSADSFMHFYVIIWQTNTNNSSSSQFISYQYDAF